MADDLNQRMDELKLKVRAFTRQVVRLVNRSAPTVATADDSTTLTNQTPAQMQAAVNASISAHSGSKSNPHSVTPDILGGVKGSDFTATLAPAMLLGLVPCSQYGALNENVLPVTSSGLTLTFASGIPFLCWGNFTYMAGLVFTLTPNKTYHIYANMLNGQPSYTIGEAILLESFSRIFIGKVVTGNTAITSNTIGKVSMVGGVRPATTPTGSSIPVSTGVPTSAVSIAPGWKP